MKNLVLAGPIKEKKNPLIHQLENVPELMMHLIVKKINYMNKIFIK